MARQFDVFRIEDGVLVVNVQSDLLDAMHTRVVAPLLPAGEAGRPMRGLNPGLRFGEDEVVLMPQLMATVAVRALGRPVGSIGHLRDAVVRAMDILLTGV
ncbi:MAG: CcdB family protein [Amaricoccus sp.]